MLMVSSKNYKSHEMYEYVHESNLIEGYDSERADIASLIAWDELVASDSPFTHQSICRVQKWVVSHQTDLQLFWRGNYRNVSGQRVWVGDREGLAPGLVYDAMESWVGDVNKWIKRQDVPAEVARALHVRFEHIHPFCDGNGRTGRMLMWLFEKKIGCKPTLIRFDERRKYYGWF